MTRRVLKWSVPVDDRLHPVGVGKVVHVDCQGSNIDVVQVWTEEHMDTGTPRPIRRQVQIFATGQELPPSARHLGSVVAGVFVWHAYEVGVGR